MRQCISIGCRHLDVKNDQIKDFVLSYRIFNGRANLTTVVGSDNLKASSVKDMFENIEVCQVVINN